MKRAIIACNMMKKDIEPIISRLDYEYDIFWLAEDLHNTPKKLGEELQKKLDELVGYDEIILTYLLCGNALVGIHSDNAPLRFLKGDDCIYACMCMRDDYKQLRTSAIFMSRGWLSTKRNPLEDYHAYVEKYGEKKTRYIYDAMYRNYKNIVYMKMSEDEEISEDDERRLNEFARITGLETKSLEGSVELYRQLLFLEDSERIVHIPAGHVITLMDTGIFA